MSRQSNGRGPAATKTRGRATKLDAVPAPGETPDLMGTLAAGEMSKRIASILDTAEEQAEAIRESARAEAQLIIRNANASVADRVELLTNEPERIKQEAEDAAQQQIAEAQADAERRVAQANDEARKMVRESEREAAEQRKQAEQVVAEMEAAMKKRRRQLDGELRSLAQLRTHAGGSVNELVEALQAAASDINERLEAIPDAEHPETPPAPKGRRGSMLGGKRTAGE